MIGRLTASLFAVFVFANPAAAQPAADRALPFVLAGALGLETEIEACGIDASAAQREQLKQAIANVQKRMGLPDEAIAKMRQEMRADTADPARKGMLVEVCKQTRTRFEEYLAEIVDRGR